MKKEKRDLRLYLEDILECIEKIDEYTKDTTDQEFRRNSLIQDAVIRRLEIIGEATRNIPQELRDQHPSIPWQDIAGMRNRLAHEYFGVLLQRAWNVVQSDLPDLKDKILVIKQSLP